jgi:hypothetical protein
MLDQIYITGGHLGGGDGAGNDGSDEGWRQWAGAAGRQAAVSAATAVAGVALEKRRWSAGGLALAACYYIVLIQWFCDLLLNNDELDDMIGFNNGILVAYGMCPPCELLVPCNELSLIKLRQTYIFHAMPIK